MDNVLKHLLNVELEAEALVKEAIDERERIMAKSLEEVQMAEARFDARIPEIRQSFLTKAEQRIEQTVAETKRRYEERSQQLEAMAEASRQEALQTAVAIILDPDQND